MTPQEKQHVDDLFDRLSQLETSPRDPQAMSAITEGLRRAPNATYALVQTVLVQDEALKQMEARIQELEEAASGAPRPAQGGFLDSMRETIFGREAPRGSVPSIRPNAPNGAWNNAPQNGAQNPAPGYGQRMNEAEAQQRPGFGGGSFLGTAAAAAAGVIGGSLLMNSLGSMMGSRGGAQSLADNTSGGASKSPWSNEGSSNNASGDLSRDAGLNDVGQSPRQGFLGDDANKASNDTNYDSGAFDTAGYEDSSDSFDLGDSDFG